MVSGMLYGYWKRSGGLEWNNKKMPLPVREHWQGRNSWNAIPKINLSIASFRQKGKYLVQESKIFENLLKIAKEKQIKEIIFKDFKASANGYLKGNKIGIRIGTSLKEINYTIAHELAHLYLHYDKTNTVKSPDHQKYEEQADRAAILILDVLQYSAERN